MKFFNCLKMIVVILVFTLVSPVQNSKGQRRVLSDNGCGQILLSYPFEKINDNSDFNWEQEKTNLIAAGWRIPVKANGVYVQKTDSLYEKKCQEDVFSIIYLPKENQWLWRCNNLNMAISNGPEPVGTYSVLAGGWEGSPVVMETEQGN